MSSELKPPILHNAPENISLPTLNFPAWGRWLTPFCGLLCFHFCSPGAVTSLHGWVGGQGRGVQDLCHLEVTGAGGEEGQGHLCCLPDVSSVVPPSACCASVYTWHGPWRVPCSAKLPERQPARCRTRSEVSRREADSRQVWTYPPQPLL